MSRVLYNRVFFALACAFCVLGLCLAFAQPLYSTPDEQAHWAVAHARAERALGHEGCVVTVPHNADLHSRPEPPLHRIPVHPPVCPPPHTIQSYGDLLTYPGVILSKIVLNRQTESLVRQVQGVLLSRLLQGMLFVLCLARVGWLARHCRRGGALLLAAFVMSPLLAQQAFAVSADGAQLSFALCVFSALLYWGELRWEDLCLFVLTGWGAAAKPFLLPCILPSVLAAFWYGELRRDAAVGAWQVIRRFLATLKPTTSLPCAYLWCAVFLCGLTVLLAVGQQGTQGGGVQVIPQGVDRYAQLAGLRADPYKVWRLAADLPRPPWSFEALTGPLGWLDAPVSEYVTNWYRRCVGLALITEMVFLSVGRRTLIPSFKPSWQRCGQILRGLIPMMVALCGCIGNFVLVTLVLYLVWTPVGAPLVEGVQTRYFFPTIIIFIALVFGALSALMPKEQEGGGAPSASMTRGPGARLVRAVAAATPTVLFLLVLPYVARVFVDLARRYG